MLVAVPVSGPITLAGVVVCPVVEISNNSYVPEVSTMAMPASGGPTLCWHNSDGIAHTATSDDGFFDTGAIMADGQAEATFVGAGTFPYHCEIHASMTGVAKVRPRASDTSVNAGDEVTLTIGNSATKGYDWDLQRKRNDGRWVTIRTETGATVVVTPARPVTYRYRAQTRNSSTEELSGWSPARKVVVSAA